MKTQKNGTFKGYILITRKNNLKLSNIKFTPDTHTHLKRVMFSKYKLNSTNLYVNLLQSNNPEVQKQNEKLKKEQKILTHLIIKLNVFTMDTEINFDRNDVPIELIQDLM